VDGFVAKITRYQPSWVAFHGKEAAKEVSKALGHRGAASVLRPSSPFCKGHFTRKIGIRSKLEARA
jgi:hypothetical protein